MLATEIRMDVARYVTRFGDRTISKVTDGAESFWLTEKGRVLVTMPEKYECSADIPEKGQTLDMVKYIVSNGNVTPASYFESIWNEGNYNVVEMEKAYNSVDTWDEPYEYDKAEGKEFVERVNDLMSLLKGE